MADNLTIKDGAGASKVLAAKDVGSVYYPRHIVVASTGTAIDFDTYLTALNNYLQSIDGHVDGLEGFVDGLETLTGGVTETAPTTDTASSGLNGRLQRIAQRLTSLITLLTRSATIDDIADVTLNNGSETSLVGADSSRREAIIVAGKANTVEIRIGKTGQVGAARGVPIQPGQSITLTTTAAIYGFASAASQTVAITLLKD